MFIWNHLKSSTQMKEYIDLFADMNERFIKLINAGRNYFKVDQTTPVQFYIRRKCVIRISTVSNS